MPAKSVSVPACQSATCTEDGRPARPAVSLGACLVAGGVEWMLLCAMCTSDWWEATPEEDRVPGYRLTFAPEV